MAQVTAKIILQPDVFRNIIVIITITIYQAFSILKI
jgi:hypothetical protein